MRANRPPGPRADRCPKCLDTVNEPKATEFSGLQAVCAYECTGCRHGWVTSWRTRGEWLEEDPYDEA